MSDCGRPVILRGITNSLNVLQSLVFAEDGVLTRELARVPGPGRTGQVPARLAPEALVTSVCGYCSTGCGLSIHLRDQRAINISPDPAYPVNRGVACPKGWEALSVLDAADRATRPLRRDATGNWHAVSWHDAMQEFCARLRRIQQKHGSEAVAVLGTGQITTEELALLGALAKFGMGITHTDGNTRQCMASAVTAYKQSFGFDAPPYTYHDLEESDVIFLIGSNLCIAHPILWERICRNAHHPKVIVVDPRRTETAMAATEHIRLAPKSDLALFHGVARQLIANGWIDRSFIARHTANFAGYAKYVEAYTEDVVADITGVSPHAVHHLARTIHEGQRVSFWWTMGVNQSYQGVRTAQALINLALLTGNIGRPGTGANSITGQCNAMGSRLFSNTTCLLGGRSFRRAADRSEVASILGIDATRIPATPSWPYPKIVEGIRAGRIRGLWIVGTNPAHSWIDQNDARALFGQLDFLVVQDMYHSTETAGYADLILPAAGWGEKTGTFINSERRIGLVRQVRVPPGEALSDFNIFRLVAEYWGCGEMFANWSSPEAVFQLLKQLSHGQPCDFSGIDDYATLAQHGGIQWPCVGPPAELDEQRRLFEDGNFFHPDRRARFIWDAFYGTPEPVDNTYPLLLNTGRGSAAQWHTQTRTAKSPVLQKLCPASIYIEIHPSDASRHGIRSGDQVRVTSRRGWLEGVAFVSATVSAGQVFVPMHYGATNRLTLAHFDPHSFQPSYKNCAVRIERVANSGGSI